MSYNLGEIRYLQYKKGLSNYRPHIKDDGVYAFKGVLQTNGVVRLSWQCNQCGGDCRTMGGGWYEGHITGGTLAELNT